MSKVEAGNHGKDKLSRQRNQASQTWGETELKLTEESQNTAVEVPKGVMEPTTFPWCLATLHFLIFDSWFPWIRSLTYHSIWKGININHHFLQIIKNTFWVTFSNVTKINIVESIKFAIIHSLQVTSIKTWCVFFQKLLHARIFYYLNSFISSRNMLQFTYFFFHSFLPLLYLR